MSRCQKEVSDIMHYDSNVMNGLCSMCKTFIYFLQLYNHGMSGGFASKQICKTKYEI